MRTIGDYIARLSSRAQGRKTSLHVSATQQPPERAYRLSTPTRCGELGLLTLFTVYKMPSLKTYVAHRRRRVSDLFRRLHGGPQCADELR